MASESSSSLSPRPQEDHYNGYQEIVGLACSQCALDQFSFPPLMAKPHLPEEATALVQLIYLSQLKRDDNKLPLTERAVKALQTTPIVETRTFRTKEFMLSTAAYVVAPFLPAGVLSAVNVNVLGMSLLIGGVAAVFLVTANTMNHLALKNIRDNNHTNSLQALEGVVALIEMRDRYEEMGDALIELNCKKVTRKHAKFLCVNLDLNNIENRITQVTNPTIATTILEKFRQRIAAVLYYAQDGVPTLFLKDYVKRENEEDDFLPQLIKNPAWPDAVSIKMPDQGSENEDSSGGSSPTSSATRSASTEHSKSANSKSQ